MVKILNRNEILDEIEVILETQDDSKLAELHSQLNKDHKTSYDKKKDCFEQTEVDWLAVS